MVRTAKLRQLVSPFQSSIHVSRSAFVFAPAATAGAIIVTSGASLTDGLFMFAAISSVGLLFFNDRSLSHPMTWGLHAINITVPLLGVVLFVVLNSLNPQHIGMEPILTACFGAVIVRFSGAYLSSWLDDRRPLRIAVVGWGELAHRLSFQLHQGKFNRYQVVGFISDHAPNYAIFDGALPRLGRIEDLRTVVQESDIDLLVLSPDTSRLDTFQEVADSCLDLPVRMIELNSLHEQLFGYVPIGTINAAWFQYVMHPSRPMHLQPRRKRAFDLIVGLAIALFAVPVIAILASMIKLWDKGPVFYRQLRIGEHGEAFQITKLRTMQTDAEAEGHPLWSSSNDQRVTGIGSFLRRTHLDELPQIFNVIKGEMTIVGPRPERPEFVRALEKTVPYYTRRHLVRPGVTGWAQVRCGYVNSVLGSAWKMGHDLYYLKHRSFLLDLLILVETVRALIIGEHNLLQPPDEELVLRDGGDLPKEAPAAVSGQLSQPAVAALPLAMES